MVSEIRVIGGIEGRAEWNWNRECVELRFYFREGDGITSADMLLPHGQSDLHSNDEISDAHTSGAIEAFEKLKDRLVEENYYLPRPERGYIKRLPNECLPWFSSAQDEFAAFVSQMSFRSLLELYPSGLPECFRPAFESLKPRISLWLSSAEVQGYLEKAAIDMGMWWAQKVGTLGSNGDENADLIHAALRSTQPLPSMNDAKRFGLAIAKDAMKNFARNRVPFYDTDYGAGRELCQVLEDNNLLSLSGSLPWKTWKHFDFPNPPKFTME